MSIPIAIPPRFHHIIWEYQSVDSVTGAFVLMRPDEEPQYNEDEDGTKQLITLLSLAPTGQNDMKPIFFHTEIEAEIYRDSILGQDPNHPVKDYVIAELPPQLQVSGYVKRQSLGVCPKCGKFAQYCDPKTGEYYCETCCTPFDPEKKS